MAETQFKMRVRLIEQMPRQADSLAYIMENQDALSESQRSSLAFAADMLRDAAKLLSDL
jgi:hypothetical protein